MKILVQKYGGTSVTTPEKRALIAQRVQKAQGEGFRVVVVVSAMGRNGEPYATDTLRSLILQEYNDVSRRELDLIMSCGLFPLYAGGGSEQQGLTARALTGIQAGFLTDGNYGEASG